MICAGQGLLNLVQNSEKEKIIGVELGCALGATTKYLLESIPNLYLYGIDPYNQYIDWNGNNITQDGLENEMLHMLSLVEPYKDRFFLYRDYSDNMVQNFDDNSLDFIFIDGLHTYDQVLKDCRNYYSKIKSGGIFSGHDFGVIPAVNKAVNQFSHEVGITQIHTTEVDVWYWSKP